jgi:hypothetical protein
MKKHKSTPHLDKYNLFMRYGNMTHNGLCGVLKEITSTQADQVPIYITEVTAGAIDIMVSVTELGYLHILVHPTRKDYLEMYSNNLNMPYWGSDSHESKVYEFTPLRQNLLLLIAAMNDEL